VLVDGPDGARDKSLGSAMILRFLRVGPLERTVGVKVSESPHSIVTEGAELPGADTVLSEDTDDVVHDEMLLHSPLERVEIAGISHRGSRGDVPETQSVKFGLVPPRDDSKTTQEFDELIAVVRLLLGGPQDANYLMGTPVLLAILILGSREGRGDVIGVNRPIRRERGEILPDERLTHHRRVYARPVVDTGGVLTTAVGRKSSPPLVR
jgi:hypothetical protein